METIDKVLSNISRIEKAAEIINHMVEGSSGSSVINREVEIIKALNLEVRAFTNLIMQEHVYNRKQTKSSN